MLPSACLVGALFLLVGTCLASNPSCDSNFPYYSLNGSCNNLRNPGIGQLNNIYQRGREGAEFATGDLPITFPQRQYERVISNKICRADPSLRDTIRHSLVATQFGQFVNHDLENNAFQDPGSATDYPDNLVVPEPDDSFCYLFNYSGDQINACGPNLPLPTFRTKPSQYTVLNGVRQVFNNATSWLDLHLIYSPNATQAAALRTGSGGHLLTFNYINFTTNPGAIFGYTEFGYGNIGPYSCYNCPPSWGQTNGIIDVTPLLNPNLNPYFPINPNSIFVSGDPRVGENAALSMFHLLFIRNHNYHADRLAASHPGWTDETLYQKARRINIAEYQNVVLYNYLPTEFGDYFADQVGDYDGYDSELDSDTDIFFASAAFRYGHSSFHNYVPRSDCGGATLFNLTAPDGVLLTFGGQTGGPIVNSDIYGEIGTWENLIRGLITEVTAPNDIFIDDSLRDIANNFGITGGTDLMALDLHRARENGVPNYVTLQEVYGVHEGRIYGSPGCPASYKHSSSPDPIGCFNVLVPYNNTLRDNVAALYGKVNNIDPFVGLLLEPHVSGTSFGPTLGGIIVREYKLKRNADRFWFENPDQPNPFTGAELRAIGKVTMGTLLRRNFNFPEGQIPDNPFLSPVNYVSTLASTC